MSGRRWLASRRLWTAVLVWGAAGLLSVAPPWRAVELKGFDLLARLTAADRTSAPIVIVAIDEASFAELGLQWPWPRTLHASLLDSLARAGAVAIAFDVVFAEPSSPAADETFAAAMTRAANVVLAADEAVRDSAYVAERRIIEPLPALTRAAAAVGVATLVADRDSVVRRIPGRPDAFWRKVLAVAGARAPFPAAPPPAGEERFIRYAGPGHPFEVVSYWQALDPARFLPAGLFANRIVLVGLDVNTQPEVDQRPADSFLTPLFAQRGWVPGVEVYANVLETLWQGRAVREAPAAAQVLCLVVLAVAGGVLFRSGRLAVGAGAVAVLGAALAATAWGLFRYLDVWLPTTASFVGLAALCAAEGGSAFARERALRRQIRRAFDHYVSPAIVSEIIAHPERLVLGGQRRDVTVLFADLAGFTALAERLPPEVVVGLLNRYLTVATGVIVDHGGTVDKYMGDAVMAFWGAPVPDDDHALHACQAAAAMERALAGLRAELAADGHPDVRARIGIHTGTAVVGNMGSTTLFDYTAVGDDVNLASRLEGANKLYDTGVLFSEGTVERLDGRIPVRPVDRVRVKGRTQAVDIYTLCDDAEVARLSAQAIAAYRERRWAAARTLWEEILARDPADGIAAVYLARLAAFERAAPAEGWDGSIPLESK